MAAFEFRSSNLTLAVTGAIFVPVQGVASAEFSFENTYATVAGDMSREFVTWTGVGDEPLRWSLGPEDDDFLTLPPVDFNQDGVFGALGKQEADDSDDDEDVDDDEDDYVPPAEPVSFVNPAVLTTTDPIPAPKASTNKKRGKGKGNTLLKKTLLESARKASNTNTMTAQGPANKPVQASKPLQAGPFMGHPYSASLQRMLAHRPKKTVVAPLGSPFCPKEAPAWVTNRRHDDASAEAGAEKRSKPSGEWEQRLARVQAASRRLQSAMAMADSDELPSSVYGPPRRNNGRKLRNGDLDLPRLR